MTINTIMEKKYSPKSQSKQGRRRRIKPETWLSGPTEYERELFYAWHKHRAQAHYRKEEYQLTYSDWREIWTPELFQQRGRSPSNVILTRRDSEAPWSLDNCHVVNRGEYLKEKASYQLRLGIGRFTQDD